MNFGNSLSRGLSSIKFAFNKNKPQILMGTAGALSVGALVSMALKAEDAADLKRAKRAEIEAREVRDHPIVERAMVEAAALPAYIPSLSMEAGSIASLVMSGSAWDSRNAALVASCGLLKEAKAQLEDKMVEKLGPKKGEEAIEEIVQEEMQTNCPVTDSKVLVTGYGDTLIFDKMSGRWFYGDVDKIKRAVNLFNQEVNLSGWATLNDFYSLINLDPIKFGDDFGCNVHHALLDVNFVADILCLEGEHERPGLAMVYDMEWLFR